MIFLVIALLLFVCVGNTGRLVRLGLTQLACLTVIYLGVPLFAICMLMYLKA